MEFGAKSCCLDRHKFPCYWTKGSLFFFTAIMNQEALREGNNIGRLMMMNRFGKTPADLKLPFPLPLQPLPVLLMQNKMKKTSTERGWELPQEDLKQWDRNRGCEDAQLWVGGKYPGGFQGWEGSSDRQRERFNSWSRDLGCKSSACHKVPFLPLQDPENPCKDDEARWRHESPAQLPGASELLPTKRKMGVKKKKSQPGQHFPFETEIFQNSFQFKFTLDTQRWFYFFCFPLSTKLPVCT